MTEIILLRIVHIVGGIFWLGSGLVAVLFLLPALADAGPRAAGAVMSAMQRRGYFTLLPIVATVTVLSGFRLAWIVSGGLIGAYFESATGRAFLLSGVAAVLAWAISLFAIRPTQARAAALAEGATALAGPARDVELARASTLRRRVTALHRATLALLLVGSAGMAVARYLS